MDRVTLFEKELNEIQDNGFRTFLESMLKFIPDEFFVKPASSSGKYHPDLHNIMGGLVWHTKHAFWIAHSLMKKGAMYGHLYSYNKDIVLGAILFHDSLRYGYDSLFEEKYTPHAHPILVKKFFNNIIKNNSEIFEEINENIYNMVQVMLITIESHMGSWSSSPNCDIILPEPDNDTTKLVHLADYMSAQVFCDFNYDKVDKYLDNNKG